MGYVVRLSGGATTGAFATLQTDEKESD